MAFNKIFGVPPHYGIYNGVYSDYYDFLRSLNINDNTNDALKIEVTKAADLNAVEYWEKGRLYLGIAPSDSTTPKWIILYVNPIDWSPPDEGDDRAIATLSFDWEKFSEGIDREKLAAAGDYMNVGGERGALKEYSGEPSFYMSQYHFYPLPEMLQVGIINWMW